MNGEACTGKPLRYQFRDFEATEVGLRHEKTSERIPLMWGRTVWRQETEGEVTRSALSPYCGPNEGVVAAMTDLSGRGFAKPDGAQISGEADLHQSLFIPCARTAVLTTAARAPPPLFPTLNASEQPFTRMRPLTAVVAAMSNGETHSDLPVTRSGGERKDGAYGVYHSCAGDIVSVTGETSTVVKTEGIDSAVAPFLAAKPTTSALATPPTRSTDGFGSLGNLRSAPTHSITELIDERTGMACPAPQRARSPSSASVAVPPSGGPLASLHSFSSTPRRSWRCRWRLRWLCDFWCRCRGHWRYDVGRADNSEAYDSHEIRDGSVVRTRGREGKEYSTPLRRLRRRDCSSESSAAHETESVERNSVPKKSLSFLAVAWQGFRHRVRRSSSEKRQVEPVAASAAAQSTRERALSTLLFHWIHVFLVFFFCCCFCPCARATLHGGRNDRSRGLQDSWGVVKPTFESLRSASHGVGRRRRARQAFFLLLYLFGFLLLLSLGLLLTWEALIAVWECELVFVMRRQYLGLPSALEPLPVPMAVTVQFPALPSVCASPRSRPNDKPSVDDGDTYTRDTAPGVVAVPSPIVMKAYRARCVGLAMEGMHLSSSKWRPLLSFSRLSPSLTTSQLPSWTLQVLEEKGGVCSSEQDYAIALKGTSAQPRDKAWRSPREHHTIESDDSLSRVGMDMQRAVLATAHAPLGRIGPMLLAIASVTDDVDVLSELPKWCWLRRSLRSPSCFSSRNTSSPKHPGAIRGQIRARCHRTPSSPSDRSPMTYLAVLGIPSTDQAARATLRSAQRQTWFTYDEVAHSRVGFEGALLPLYIFGAAERQKWTLQLSASSRREEEHVAGVGAEQIHRGQKLGLSSSQNGTTADMAFLSRDSRRLGSDPSLLLPTFSDFAAATEHYANLLWTLAHGNPTNEVAVPISSTPFTRRRMTLRQTWRRETSMDSPCDKLVSLPGASHAVPNSVPIPTLVQLADELSLPVTPLFTSPARFVCYASTALWQEALQHRDAVWVDMLTDRRPTTKKKLGDNAKWGLAVEVGMSQKLILWLCYAYTAFPDVPYIMKGDDDTYVKVPQYLSDLRYLQRGRKGRRLAKGAAGGRLAVQSHGAAVTGGMPLPLTVGAAEECVYWGSMRRWNGELYFSAGMLLLLHRQLVQALMEVRAGENNDVIHLAARDYSAVYAHTYYASIMDHEDVMLGKLLMERRRGADRLCPQRRHWYVWEDLHRFHDLRSHQRHNVTWSSVVLHRCHPADFFLLHFFVLRHLHQCTRRGAGPGEEAAACEAVEKWVETCVKARYASLAPRRAHDKNGGAPIAYNVTASHGICADDPLPHEAGEARGWDDLPLVRWTASQDQRWGSQPTYSVTSDGVAVHDVEYVPFNDGALVLNGWRARI